jgi:hypothetical protein
LLAEWSASSAMPQETLATQLHTRYNFPISGYEINIVFNLFMAFKMILIAFGLSQLIHSMIFLAGTAATKKDYIIKKKISLFSFSSLFLFALARVLR